MRNCEWLNGHEGNGGLPGVDRAGQPGAGGAGQLFLTRLLAFLRQWLAAPSQR
jgi:hypothetical protein